MTIDITTDRLSSIAGISLAGKVFQSIGLNLEAKPEIPHREVIRTMAGLLVQGRTSFAEIELFKRDRIFQESLNLCYTPAQETLRLYLEKIAIGIEGVNSTLTDVNLRLLKKTTFSTVITELGEYIPVDMDVSTMDNSGTFKEGVGRTYKGFDGYAPIFCYLGLEGYMLLCELRPGVQHCQKGAPEFIQKVIDLLPELNLDKKFLIRLDSGHDAKETLNVLLENKHPFIVKKNFRRESLLPWLDLAMGIGVKHTPREGKNVYIGSVTAPHPTADNQYPDIEQVFKVTVRETDAKGNPFLFPDLDVEVYFTNLNESPETIIDLYHNHGLSEQFHSELKTDMSVERFPSGKMSVNSLILHISMIVFNTLRFIGQKALKFKELLPYKHRGKRKRLRKVIDDLIRVSCKIVRHSNQWKIKLWQHDPWYLVFAELYRTI